MFRLLVMVALIGITVALTNWLQDLQQELRRAPDKSLPKAPDYRFRQVVLTMMGMDGAPRYRIRAPRMTHFASTDGARLVSPKVWFYLDEGPPVELRAQRAHVAAGGKRIWLEGKVDITRAAHAGDAPLAVQTRDVTVLPEARKARTRAPVRAVNGDQRLSGVGMMLDLLGGTLHLESRVRSIYVP